MHIKWAIAILCACFLSSKGANAQTASFETFSDALNFLLGAGFENCGIAPPSGPAPGIPNPDLTILPNDQGFDEKPGLIGPNLSRHCFPNVEETNLSGGSVVGGSLSSLQSTRTVSQFDASRRRSQRSDTGGETRSNFSYEGSLTQSGDGYFSLVDDGDGITEANVLVPFEGFSVFGQVEYEDYRQSSTRYEPAKDVDIFTMQLGALWTISQDSIVGFKGIYSTGDGESRGPENVVINVDDADFSGPVLVGDRESLCGVPDDGTVDTDEFGGSILYQGTVLDNGFIAAEVGASKGRVDYKNSLCTMDLSADGSGGFSPVNETAGIIRGSPDYFGLSADVKSGYDWDYNGVSIGPRLTLKAWWKSIEEYSESEDAGSPNPITGVRLPITGASLRYQDQDISSVQTRIGIAASTPVIVGRMTVVPFAQMDYIHEFAYDQREIKVTFVEDGRPDPLVFSFKTNRPDRDFFELRGGMVAEVSDGRVAYFEGHAILGNDLVDNVGVIAGLRFGF